MSERLRHRAHDFYVSTYHGAIWPMHIAPSDGRSSHAVGRTKIHTRAELMAAVNEHIDAYDDVGNCRGYVPVQIKPFGTIHIGRLDVGPARADARTTLCGVLIPGPTASYRVIPGRLDRVTCRSCPPKVFLP